MKFLPFESDLEYLSAEHTWVRARANRLESAIEMHEDAADGDVERGRPWLPQYLARLCRTQGNESLRPQLVAIEHRYHRVISRAQGESRRSRRPRRRRAFEMQGSDVNQDMAVQRAQYQRRKEIEDALRSHVDGRIAETHRQGKELAVFSLCERYNLGQLERTILLLAAYYCISSELMHKAGPWGSKLDVESAFFFAELRPDERVRERRILRPSAPLLTHDLVKLEVGGRLDDPGGLINARIVMPTRTFNFLVGDAELADDFQEFSSIEDPRANLAEVVLGAEDKRRILDAVEQHDRCIAVRKAWGLDDRIRYGRGLTMLFSGPPGTGKTMTAHAVARQLGKRILRVDLLGFISSKAENDLLAGVFREARLHDAVAFFDECEVLFADRERGNFLMNLFLTELERFEGIAVLATNSPEVLDPALIRRMLVRVNFPAPDAGARARIWAHHLPPAAQLAPDVDIVALASRHELAGGYIKNAVLTALAAAVRERPEAPELTMRHLECAAREQLRGHGGSGPQMCRPTFGLDRVVARPDLAARLAEILEAARVRRTIIESWGIGKHLESGMGVVALFVGEPGTGKTLAAEALAGELARPLLVASIAAVASKWVGETEKNLERTFQLARAEGAVLFFDEADSLLATRGGPGSSRHDDTAVNVLLNLLDRHEGLTILATNRLAVLDSALSRRIAYRAEFPLPGREERTRIWSSLLPPTVPTDGSMDCADLGRRYDLSGGQIHQAVLRAAVRVAGAGGVLTQAELAAAAAEILRQGNGIKEPMGFQALTASNGFPASGKSVNGGTLAGG